MRKVSLLLAHLFVFTCLGYAQTVTIGTQVWMTKNLNVDKFRNGDPIPQAKTNEEWYNAGVNRQPAWCYYNNDPANGTKYGKLYNWFAVNDPRDLAPEGWHVPSDAEWTKLGDYLGGKSFAGGKMKSTTGWDEPNTDATNSSGWSGLPGGYRGSNGSFNGIGSYGYWWSSTEYSTDYAWYRFLYYNYGDVIRLPNSSKPVGYSVRCVRD
jgi:uncharacterized protein (TIGR02145 family)